MAHLLCQNWEWHNTKIRIVIPVIHNEQEEALVEATEKLLEDARLEAELLPINPESMNGQMLRIFSSDADCVFINVDLPDDEDADQWYSNLDDQIEGLPTTIMVHSTIKADILI